MHEIVYLDGRYVPISEAKISVMNHGFLYGYGLFETLRSYNGKLFRLGDHLNRLKISTERLALSVNFKDLYEVVSETLRRNKFQHARVRLTITPVRTIWHRTPTPATIPLSW